MNTFMEQDIEYLAQQSSGNLNMILAGMTTLMNDTDKKVEALESQSWFKRMVKTITGQNKLTKDEIQKNNEKMNAYMAEAISELYRKNCIDESIIMSLGNQINELYADHLQLKQMLGSFVNKLNEKIDSVDNFHMLTTEIEQGVYSSLPPVLAICKILSQFDNRILKDDRKLDIIRRDLSAQAIISEEEISMSDIFLSVIGIPENDIGLVFMEIQTYSSNFMAANLIKVIESYFYLPDMERKMINKSSFVSKTINNLELDGNVSFSKEYLYDSFIQSKIDVISEIALYQEKDNSKEEERAEELYKNYDIVQAYPIFVEQANSGNGRAMYFLGEYYGNGYGGIKANQDEALEWRRKGYEAGNELASLNYACSLSDDAKKKEIFRDIANTIINAAENGDVFAQSELSWMFKDGLGVEKNEKESFHWALEAAQTGYWYAEYKIGRYYESGIGVEKNEQTAFEWYLKSANRGYLFAQNTVGFLLSKGKGVTKDISKANEWYKKAGEQGNDIALWNLAINYDNEGNMNRAVMYYKKAAECGNVSAQKQLGRYFKKGHGSIVRDYAEAAKWFGMAAEQDDPEAIYEYGMAFWIGDGVDRNPHKGLELLKKAADLGYVEAQVYVADQMMGSSSSDYIPHDKETIEEAISWYQRAIDNGDTNAVLNLAYYYRKGIWWFEELQKQEYAIQLYEKAIEMGNDAGYINLAQCYENGEGVKKDLNEALRYYRIALEKGYFVSSEIKRLEKLV